MEISMTIDGLTPGDAITLAQTVANIENTTETAAPIVAAPLAAAPAAVAPVAAEDAGAGGEVFAQKPAVVPADAVAPVADPKPTVAPVVADSTAQATAPTSAPNASADAGSDATVDVDRSGQPWDERIHGAKRNKVARSGLWTLKKA